jgi:TatD DNase family protein
MFTDTHAHLCWPDFANDCPQIIQRAAAAGVTRIVSVATTLADAATTTDIAARHPGVYAAVGLHPSGASVPALAEVKQLAGLARRDKVVAIGEIGLDYHYEAKDNKVLRVQQRDLFWAQLELAKEHQLPVIIHNRDAEDDMREILDAHAEALPKEWRPWGVMHCFSGDEKFAYDCIELGLLVSFAGVLTFKNATEVADVANKVSLDYALIETDAPYLAPAPHRGKRNEPSFLPHTAAALAQIKGATVAEVAKATSTNAAKLFRF